MSERRTRTLVALALTACLVALAGLPAIAADVPYEQQWRIQSEVGGDIGGRSHQTVTGSSVSIKAAEGRYTGTVQYQDRLVIEDPQGGVLVQVSSISLQLDGSPAGGGTGMGGLFDGRARLDDYHGVSWEDAIAGRLPVSPSRMAVYSVAGRWAAFLSGSSADGELLYESASIASKNGDIDPRDASWFNRSGSRREQVFRASVEGAVASGGSGAGGGAPAGSGAGLPGGGSAPGAKQASVLDYMRAGLRTDVTRGPLAAVPLSSALAARALRDARPKGATPLPANSRTIDLDVSGLTLDAKNRAAGLSASLPEAQAATRAWEKERAASGEPSRESTVTRLVEHLEGETTDGAPELLRQVRTLSEGSRAEELDIARMLTEWLAVVRALDRESSSVLGSASRLTFAIDGAHIPQLGPKADGLLADADSPSASDEHLRVSRFARRTGEDVYFVRDGKRVILGAPAATAGDLIHEVLDTDPLRDKAPVVRYDSAGASGRVSPPVWLAYERADGVTFWLAGKDGPVAFRDGSLAGWAFSSRAMRLVSSSRCGQTLSILTPDGTSRAAGQ